MRYKDEIRKLRFDEGLSYGQIAEILGCAKSTVSFYCAKEDKNQSLKNLSRLPDSEDYSKITDYQKEKIKEYYSQGINIPMIAEFLNIKENVVLSFVNRNKLVRVVEENLTPYEMLRRNRRRVKRLSVDYLGGQCSKCGYNRCLDALDFHHVDPKQKDFNISRSYKKWRLIKEELSKCVLVCANCHRELHSTQGDASGPTQIR